MTETGAAAAALSSVREARAELAKKLDCPPWGHALFGGLYGALVAAIGAPEGLVLWIDLAVMAAGVAMFVGFRRRTGFFVNGYRRGRTRPIMLVLLAAYGLCLALAMWCRSQLKLTWPAFALGLLMFLLGTWASRAWRRAYLAELRGEVAV